MTNRDVYGLALALLAEGGDRMENGDYEERAGYLLSAFCTEVQEVNRRFCAVRGEEAPEEFPIYLSLDGEFPVKERFSGAAGAYLASMLVLEEDLELSDRLFARYCDLITQICTELPMRAGKTVNRYGN